MSFFAARRSALFCFRLPKGRRCLAHSGTIAKVSFRLCAITKQIVSAFAGMSSLVVLRIGDIGMKIFSHPPVPYSPAYFSHIFIM